MTIVAKVFAIDKHGVAAFSVPFCNIVSRRWLSVSVAFALLLRRFCIAILALRIAISIHLFAVPVSLPPVSLRSSLARLEIAVVSAVAYEFLIRVSVPEDTEILRCPCFGLCDDIALDVMHLLCCRAPELSSAVGRVYVCGDATSGIVLVGGAIEYLSCSCVAEICPVWIGFMHHEIL